MKVFKQELKIDKNISQEVTCNKLLTAKIIDGKLFVWFEFNDEDGSLNYNFSLIAITSGQSIPSTHRLYFKTVFNDDGHLYHLYH